MKNKTGIGMGIGIVVSTLLLTAATIITKISEFPQVTTPGTNDLFLLASGATNKNIKYSALKTAIGAPYLPLAGGVLSGDVSNSATGYFQVPVGTSAQGPVVGNNNGRIRYNTDLQRYDFGSASSWQNFVKLDGDSMTDYLTLVADPISALHAATKQYVDTHAGGGPGVTNIFETVIVTTSYTVNGKNNTLVVTNNITLVTNGTFTLSNLPAPSVLIVGTNHQMASATLSGLTLSDAGVLTATGGGGGANTAPLLLSYSGGTNVAGDYSRPVWYVNVTNALFFSTPSNFPGSATASNTEFTIFLKQDATGTWPVSFTNGQFKFGGADIPIIPTNANAVSVLTFTTSPYTAGQLIGGAAILNAQ